MTIMYTIGCIIMSLAFALAFYNIILMFERKRKVWLLPILVVVGILLILSAIRTPALDRYYDVENPHSYQDLFPEAYEEGYNKGNAHGLDNGFDTGFESGYDNGYREGYKKAIEEAVLVTVMEDGSYIISFNGENNVYTCNITGVDIN